MRWAIGAIAAVLGAMVLLPGVASAHHVAFEGEIVCSNGTFHVSGTYFAGSNANNSDERTIEVLVFDSNININNQGDRPNTYDQYDGNPNDWAGMTITRHTDNRQGPDFEWDDNNGTANDHFHAEDGYYPGPNGFEFIEVDGNYDGLNGYASDSVEILADMNPKNNLPAQSGDDSIYIAQTGSSDIPNQSIDFDGCKVNICAEGEGGFETDTELSFKIGEGDFEGACVTKGFCEDGHRDSVTLPEQLSAPTGTGDCDFVRVCVEGHNIGVTEFDQQEKGLQLGACEPPVTPPTPPTTPPTVTTPPAPVQQVAAAVSEVLPARLPSTGMGPDESASSFSWGAAAAVVLLGLGGLTALMARRRES